MLNSKVEISYWVKNLAPAGIYQIEITEGDTQIHKYKFMVDPLLEKKEILLREATGDETTLVLSHNPIWPNSLRLKENNILMVLNEDYVIDDTSGVITFLNRPLGKSTIEASYRIKGLSTGPFEIPYPNYAHNTAIPGVVLAFGRGVSVGDKHYVIIHPKRGISALEYSGKWDTTISLDVYAKDSVKIEEIIDITTAHLNTYRKSDLDAEGILLVDVNFGGESEEIYDEGTGDLFFQGSVEYTFLTEWIMHKPILQSIDFYFNESEIILSTEPFLINRNMQFERIK